MASDKKKRVKIHTDTFISGRPVFAGHVEDVSEEDASLLFEGNKATETKENPVVAPNPHLVKLKASVEKEEPKK